VSFGWRGRDKAAAVTSTRYISVRNFDTDDEAIAHILARHATVALATARHEQTMSAAVDVRKLVGQAMGILMERYGVDGDRAFAILKRYSRDTNTKLRDVAQQLIDTPLRGTHALRTRISRHSKLPPRHRAKCLCPFCQLQPRLFD
jgi:hypothetical protein